MADSASPKIQMVDDESIEIDTSNELSSSPSSLAVNKIFAKNILKQVGDHNRIKADGESRSLRKFENEIRKKLTKKNLKQFSAQRTMYSDFVSSPSINLKAKKSVLTPFEQVKKLVTDAAAFDEKAVRNAEGKKIRKVEQATSQSQMHISQKNRIMLDKTLLHNHLKHSSVHNRLKEEDEMWEQHKWQHSRKIKSLTSRSASERKSRIGSLYSDREETKVKLQRVTSDEHQPFGKYTLKLLHEKEKDPDKWSHNGFQQLYEGELENIKRGQKSRKSLVSTVEVLSDENDVSEYELDQEKPRQTLTRRRIVKKIDSVENLESVNPKEKKKKKQDGAKSARTIIMNTLKSDGNETNSKQKKANKRKFEVRGSLHSDMMEDETYTKRNKSMHISKRKWGHDGFDELSNDKDRYSDSSPKKVKSLAVPKHLNGTCKIPATLDRHNKKNLSGDDCSENIDTTLHPSKTASPTKTKNSVWKRLKDDSSGRGKSVDVNRATLKNSIHHEVSPLKSARRRVLTQKKKTKKVNKHLKDIVNTSDEEMKQIKRKIQKAKRIVKRKQRRYSTSSSSASSSSPTSNNSGSSDSSSYSDSSLTESSEEEKVRKVKVKKRNLKQKKSKGTTKKKDNQHKATFSDYDSDFKQKH